MRIKLVIRVVAILLLIISFFMLTPILFAFYYKEFNVISSFVIPIVSMMLLSFFLFLCTQKIDKKILTSRDAFLLVSLSWITVCAFSAIPFVISGSIKSYTDAFFETMSGYTTTGASILTEIEALPKAILFWRSLTHWLGGMGIIVLTVAILPLLGVGGMQLIKAEAPGPILDKITSRITETAKILWITYLVLTIMETTLLMLGGLNLFEALTNTFGTLATGGFCTKNKSIGHYNSVYVHWVITIFMIIAGINFSLYFKLVSGKIKDVFKNTELRVYLLIFFIAVLIISFDLMRHNFFNIIKSFQFAGFQAASILTTTGYATDNFEKWPAISRIVLFLLMFIGGCSGSTGGGIKVIRIVTLFKHGLNELKKLVHPRGIFRVKIDGYPIEKNVINAITGFFFIYIFTLLLTAFVVATGGNDILTSISTALVTVGNIGPGFGKIGPTDNYAFYQDYIKWFLSLAMMAGRLEIYTVIVILTPHFWNK